MEDRQDLIQRQAVLDALRARFGVDFDYGKWWSSSHVLAAIESVPPVTPQPCEDAISRKAVIEITAETGAMETQWRVRELPPVKPQYTDAEIQKMQELEQAEIEKAYELGKAEQQKAGRWEWVQYDSNPNIGNWHCSECRRIVLHMPEELDNTPIYKWCPMCGAKMIEPKERKK